MLSFARKWGHPLVLICFTSLIFTIGCGPRRQKRQVSATSAEVQFPGHSSPSSAQVPSDPMAVLPYLGNYDIPLFRNSSQVTSTINISTEDLEVDGQEMTFGKIHLTAPGAAGMGAVDFTSLLAYQTGTYGQYPAVSFTSTVQVIPNLSGASVALYLILAIQNNQVLPQQSAAYIIDCFGAQGSACVSNTPATDAHFGTIINHH